MFYKAAVQAILLFGSDTWVVTPGISQILGSFHHRVAHRMRGMKPQCVEGGNW